MVATYQDFLLCQERPGNRQWLPIRNSKGGLDLYSENGVTSAHRRRMILRITSSWTPVEAQDVLVTVSQHHDLQPPTGLKPTPVTLALLVGLLVETFILIGVPIW